MKSSDIPFSEGRAKALLGDLSAEAYRAIEQRLGREVFVARLDRELRLRTSIFEPFFGGWPVEHPDFVRFGLKCLGLYARGRCNALDIRLETNEVYLPGWPKELDGYRILHLSDLHFESNMQVTDRIIAMLPGIERDICVLTGDYRARTFGPFQLAMYELERLRSHIPGPVFAVLGNHDSIAMLPAMQQMDLPVLFNEGVRFSRGAASFLLAGIDDPHYYQSWDIPRALASRDEGMPVVLLSHSARPYREAAGAGVSFFLCGHSHGGQLCLPGGFPLRNNEAVPRRMVRGLWTYREMMGYTSRGAGTTGIEARYNCPPEITLHILRSAHVGFIPQA